MATAIYPLRRAAIGLETDKGTLVAATKNLVGNGVYIPEITREFETYPRGIRGNVTGGGFAIHKGSTFEFETNLDYEQVLYFLLTGLINDATPDGSGPYTWVFDPTITANSAVSMKTATLEYVIEDGATKHYERESGYGVTSGFVLDLAFNQPAKFTATMFARAEQTSNDTSGLTPISGRANIPSNLFAVYIDDAGGTIGSTAKSLMVRSLTLTVDTGHHPDFTLDGRTDLDFTQVNSQRINVQLQMVLEHAANAATEIGHWRSGNVRLVRIKADNGAAAGANRQIQFDGAYKYVEPPQFSEENGIELVTMNMTSDYDSTLTKTFAAQVINGISAQSGL